MLALSVACCIVMLPLVLNPGQVRAYAPESLDLCLCRPVCTRGRISPERSAAEFLRARPLIQHLVVALYVGLALANVSGGRLARSEGLSRPVDLGVVLDDSLATRCLTMLGECLLRRGSLEVLATLGIVLAISGRLEALAVQIHILGAASRIVLGPQAVRS